MKKSKEPETDKVKPNIIDYLDYRAFLEDYFDYMKSLKTSFSHRFFLKKAGIPATDAGVISKIIKGKANLSQGYRIKFEQAIQFSEKERQFFEYLVQFNQAKTMEQKNYFFSFISRFTKSKAAILSHSQFKLYAKWYYSVIRTYFSMNSKVKDPAAISRELFPPVSVLQVKEAIQILLNLDLIKKTANGYAVTEKHVTTDKEVENMFAHQYIKEVIHLSSHVFDLTKAKDRYYYSVTFSASENGFEKLKERLESFKEEQKALIKQDENENRIYTMNFQLYPNSKIE